MQAENEIGLDPGTLSTGLVRFSRNPFSSATELSFVLAESVLIAMVGGGLGIGLAKLFTLGPDPTGGMLPIFYLGPESMALGLALAPPVGLLAGAIPAITAKRLKIVDALRRV